MRYKITALILFSIVFWWSSSSFTQTQVGRVDASAQVVRVTVSGDGKLYAWDQAGKIIAGWPKDLSQENRVFILNPRLVDVDFDGQEEVVAVSKLKDNGNLRLHVFKGDGQEMADWRFDLPYSDLLETPILADVNHDSVPEIIFATKTNRVFIYGRDFKKIEDFSVDAAPILVVGDLDNNGLDDLYIAAGSSCSRWDPAQPDSLIPLPLPTGSETILSPLAIADVNKDLYPDLVYATNANHIIAVDRNGNQILNIPAPEGEKIVSGVIAEDVDADNALELITLTDAHNILAFKLNGTAVVKWRQPLLYRMPLPMGGVVANDLYAGLFSTSSGLDLYTIYRNKLGDYSHIFLGENVHDWDSKADFDFIEPISITDVFAFPKLITPNGDGVNDTAQIHYTLSDDALVSLDLYDSHERFLSHIFEKQSKSAGVHQETFNGLDTKGTETTKDDAPLDTGAYILKIIAQSKEGFVSSSEVNILVNGIKAEIESPQNNSSVFGKITISGLALDPNFGENNLDADFKSYKLYYRPGVWNISPDEVVNVGKSGSGWLPLTVPARNQCADNAQNEPIDAAFPNSNVSCRPVQHGELGVFDTTNTAVTPNGDYTLLLKTLDSNGNTVGKVNYATTTVLVHNASAGDSYDPKNLYDPRNPNNPLYKGPKITDAALSSSSISKENPNTTIRYTLQNETSNIHIDIFPYNGGSLGSAVSSYSFDKQAPAAYTFNWNGANTLGRNVDGGHYKIRIAASAIDGTGSDINESLEFDVTRGFSSRDILAVNSFDATPDHFNPFGFGSDLAPEKTAFGFALTKTAKVTLQIFNAKPEDGGVVQKTLLADQLRKSASVLWDGTADNGVILSANKDYVVRLTAIGTDIGNDEKVVKDIVVHLEQEAVDPGLTARLVELKGDVGEDYVNDGSLNAMAGNPDFIWRAKGTGYVEVPFSYQISASGTETYTQYSTNTSGAQPMYRCMMSDQGDVPISNGAGLYGPIQYSDPECLQKVNAGFAGFTTRPLSVSSDLPLQNFDVMMNGSAGHVYHSNGSDVGTSHSYSPSYVSLPNISIFSDSNSGSNVASNATSTFASSSVLVQNGTVSLKHYANGATTSSCVNTGILCPTFCEYSDGSVFLTDGWWDYGPHWNGCPLIADMNTYHLTMTADQLHHLYPNAPLLTCKSQPNWLYQCGTITVTTHGAATATRAWPVSGQNPSVSSGNLSLNSLSLPAPNANLVSFSASVGSGQADTSNVVITGYNLALNNTINGYSNSGSSTGSTVALPALAGWLDGGNLHAETRDNFGNRITTFSSDRDDPYTAGVPYGKIWGVYRGFNKDGYHPLTNPINIYTSGYLPNVWGNDPERNLYSFSDAVHITDWQIEIHYPNISVDKPNGDNPLDNGTGALNIFHLEAPVVTAAGVRGFKNSNIEDTFQLKLLPEAQAKRFVEIHGSAGPNYELYYYDASQENPGWYRIPPRTHNAVTNDILAHWDVTQLNGKNYTLVLKTPNPTTGKINQDTFNIGIGTKIDTTTLKSGEIARVDSTFKRASLLFGPGTLSQPELVTLNPVPRNQADFHLPNGIAPMGPVFDIKPDGLKIDPRYQVQLELTFSVDEIKNTFGVADPSELQIYNLAGDEVLEGLVTVAQLDTHGDSDPTNDVYHFTANLEHFSQYILAKKQTANFYIASPKSDSLLKGTVQIQGRVEKNTRPVDQKEVPGELANITALTVSFYDPATPTVKTVINTGAQASFDIPWDVSSLNGNFVLLFETQNADGSFANYTLPVAIDNTASQSTLLVNGQAVTDGGSITAGRDSVLEIKASDDVAGVSKIEYGWDGAVLTDYVQPFTISFVAGNHTIAYRATDKNNNVENLKQATIQLQETASAAVVSQNSLNLSLSGASYTNANQTWVTGDTQFAIQSNGGSLDQIKYRTGGPTYQAYANPFSLGPVNDGLYLVEYYSVDSNGLRGDLYSKQVLLDSTAPVTTVSFSGAYQQNGAGVIVTPDTQITLTANDLGSQPSGLNRIEYRFGTDPWSVYRNPLVTNTSKTLSYRSIDNLGNTELEKSVLLQMDNVPPTFQLSGMPPAISPNGDGRMDTIEFSISATDNFSQNFFVTFALTGRDHLQRVVWDRKPLDQSPEGKLVWDGKISGALLPEDIYTYSLQVSDAQGNLSQAETGNLVYDITPPQVTLLGGQILSFSPNGDALSDVLQVGYQLSDNLATQNIKTELHILSPEGFEIEKLEDRVSLSSQAHQFSWDGSNLANNPVFDGTYRYSIVAEDPAGNRSIAKVGEANQGEGQIFIDRIPPTTSILIDGPKFEEKERIWIGPTAKINLSASDPEPASGVRAIQYAFGDGSLQNFSAPFSVPMEGEDYLLRYQAVDIVGNKEVEKSLKVRLDKTPPTVDFNVGEPKIGDNGSTWVSPKTPITFTAQDGEGAGVKEIAFTLPEVGEWLAYQKDFTLSGLKDGLKNITYHAEDNVGNRSADKTLSLSLDSTPPVTKLVIGDPKFEDATGIYVTSATPIDFAVTTERNDLKKSEYKIDDGQWLTAGPFQLPQEKKYQISYHSFDTLDNEETANTQSLIVDNTPPDPKMILSQGDGDRYLTRQTNISLDGIATGAGLDATEYKIDNGAWQTYTAPFGVASLGSGAHIIIYRSRDKLGNISPEKKFTANLVDVAVQREDFSMPRVLVYLLQNFDLRKEDPRPNADLLSAVLKEMGGYYKITDNLDEFIQLLRSGKFTTTIFATDSEVVNFSKDEKVVRTLKELKSHIDKGDALINMTGFSNVSGESWQMFKGDWSADQEKEIVALLAPVSELQNSVSTFRYGEGRIVSFNANVGLLNKDASSEAALKSVLNDLIENTRPKGESLNAGVVVDSRLTFTNSGDQPVAISVKEVFPSGSSIETADTKGEVPVDVRNYSLAIPALDKISVDYLYRLPFEINTHKLVTEISATWKSGITDKTVLESSYKVEKDLSALLASVNLPLPSFANKSLGKDVLFSTAKDQNDVLDTLLKTIDATDRKTRDMQLNLDQAVESVEVTQLANASSDTSTPSTSPGDTNHPSSFQGPTASYVKGSCQLNRTAEADEGWMIGLFALLVLISLRSRRATIVKFFVITVGMLFVGKVFAGDTGVAGFDRQLFHPAADQTGIYNVVGTEIPPNLKLRASFVTHFGSDPTTVVVPATNRTVEILKNFWSADLLAATGYWDHFSVGLDLPLLLYESGTNFDSLQPFSAVAIGDLKLDLKYRLVSDTEKFPAVAFFSRFSFPTGSQEKFSGERGVTWEYLLVMDKKWNAFTFFSNLGFKIRPAMTLFSSTFGDAFVFGLGGRYPLPWQRKTWSLETEFTGESLFGSAIHSSIPLEWRFGVRKKWDDRMTTFLGVGKGLTDAIGSPQFRLFGGVQWQF